MEPLPFRKGCEAHALNLVSRPFLGADYVDPLVSIRTLTVTVSIFCDSLGYASAASTVHTNRRSGHNALRSIVRMVMFMIHSSSGGSTIVARRIVCADCNFGNHWTYL